MGLCYLTCCCMGTHKSTENDAPNYDRNLNYFKSTNLAVFVKINDFENLKSSYYSRFVLLKYPNFLYSPKFKQFYLLFFSYGIETKD